MGRKEKEERRKQQLKQRRRAEKHMGRRSTQEAAEIDVLEARIRDGAPPPGTNPLALDGAAAGSYAGARAFDELPLSQRTRDALKAAKFTQLTAIQRAALPHALAGRDVLGAAKTGSGKTLSFLIPVGGGQGFSSLRTAGAPRESEGPLHREGGLAAQESSRRRSACRGAGGGGARGEAPWGVRTRTRPSLHIFYTSSLSLTIPASNHSRSWLSCCTAGGGASWTAWGRWC